MMNQIEKSVDFQKGDKLDMIVPDVIYWGADKWNGSRSFEGVFDVSREVYNKSILQYDFELVSPYDLKDEDFSNLIPNWVQFLNL